MALAIAVDHHLVAMTTVPTHETATATPVIAMAVIDMAATAVEIVVEIVAATVATAIARTAMADAAMDTARDVTIETATEVAALQAEADVEAATATAREMATVLLRLLLARMTTATAARSLRCLQERLAVHRKHSALRNFE